MKNFKRSKAKTSKAKTSKTKTPEYLLDESFVFVYFLTVHLSCQCGMSKKCKKFEKWRISKGQKLRHRKLRPRKLRPPNIFWTKALFSFFPNFLSQLPVGNVKKMSKIWKMKNFKRSKAKTSQNKTPEYLSDESFVFVYFLTVHLSCQCGMSKKCEKLEKWRISKGQKLRHRKLRPRNLKPSNIFWTKVLFSFFPNFPSQLPVGNF